MKTLLCMIAILPLVPMSPSERRARASGDTIKIVNITSARPVHRGVENEFTVKVEYTLDSEDDGIIMLGFNTQAPKASVMVQSEVVHKGSGTTKFRAKVIPVDWEERGKFAALVNLSKYPHENPWKTLADDRQVIAVEP
ncbi:MAG TPA: hypothetical protein VKJ45_29125 [Blastocatellia bacterium]|nr:hypothetical protein [Blastocatellia bacterium]